MEASSKVHLKELNNGDKENDQTHAQYKDTNVKITKWRSQKQRGSLYKFDYTTKHKSKVRS